VNEGLQDELLISKPIFEDCRKRIKGLNMDSVLHSWIEKRK
jgi:hypothetical protein